MRGELSLRRATLAQSGSRRPQLTNHDFACLPMTRKGGCQALARTLDVGEKIRKQEKPSIAVIPPLQIALPLYTLPQQKEVYKTQSSFKQS